MLNTQVQQITDSALVAPRLRHLLFAPVVIMASLERSNGYVNAEYTSAVLTVKIIESIWIVQRHFNLHLLLLHIV